jgi:hypothetical protein
MKALRWFALSCLLVGALWASNATGKWKGEFQTPNGNTFPVNMDLKAGDNGSLTGTVSGRNGPIEISNGKVDGDHLSFDVIREFNGNQFKQHYDGTISGDTIHFKITMEGGMGGGRARELDVKRVTE